MTFVQRRLSPALDGYRDGAGQKARRAIVDELRRGHRAGTNPKVVARRIAKRVEKVAVTRAMTIARTEMMVATWSRTANEYSRDARVTGWQWQATKDGRTCVICTAMHGTVHPKTERLQSHPNCRCAMLPITDPNSLPIAPDATGEALFARLPARQQRQRLGTDRQAAYREAGSLSALIGESFHPVYGTQRAMIPTRRLRRSTAA